MGIDLDPASVDRLSTSADGMASRPSRLRDVHHNGGVFRFLRIFLKRNITNRVRAGSRLAVGRGKIIGSRRLEAFAGMMMPRLSASH